MMIEALVVENGPAAPATGGRAQIDQAILALWPTAYRIARLILRDDDAARDVAQESCMRALQKREQLRNPNAVAPWFRVLVSNLALTQKRRAERRAGREVELSDQLPQIATEPSASLDLAAALARLSDDVRLPLILHCYVGLSSAEIGKQLRIPAATVRYKIATARTMLRPQLEVHQNG
jgi:RNA polymerase sigma-70 factor (ECF subfamily)